MNRFTHILFTILVITSFAFISCSQRSLREEYGNFLRQGFGQFGQLDTDRDGYSDADDNCPRVSNIGQTDTDGDGIGDVCEVGFANADLSRIDRIRNDDDNDNDRDDDSNQEEVYTCVDLRGIPNDLPEDFLYGNLERLPNRANSLCSDYISFYHEDCEDRDVIRPSSCYSLDDEDFTVILTSLDLNNLDQERSIEIVESNAINQCIANHPADCYIFEQGDIPQEFIGVNAGDGGNDDEPGDFRLKVEICKDIRRNEDLITTRGVNCSDIGYFNRLQGRVTAELNRGTLHMHRNYEDHLGVLITNTNFEDYDEVEVRLDENIGDCEQLIKAHCLIINEGYLDLN